MTHDRRVAYILAAILIPIAAFAFALSILLTPPPLIPPGDMRAYVGGCVVNVGNINVAMRVAIDNVEIANRSMAHRARECIGALVDPGTHAVSTSCYMADGSAKAWEENVSVSSRQILYLPSDGSYACP